MLDKQIVNIDIRNLFKERVNNNIRFYIWKEKKNCTVFEWMSEKEQNLYKDYQFAKSMSEYFDKLTHHDNEISRLN